MVGTRIRSPRAPQQAPYLLPPSGDPKAFTIDLVSRPAAAVAVALRSRRCLRLITAFRGSCVPDLRSGGSIGSTARQFAAHVMRHGGERAPRRGATVVANAVR